METHGGWSLSQLGPGEGEDRTVDYETWQPPVVDRTGDPSTEPVLRQRVLTMMASAGLGASTVPAARTTVAVRCGP